MCRHEKRSRDERKKSKKKTHKKSRQSTAGEQRETLDSRVSGR